MSTQDGWLLCTHLHLFFVLFFKLFWKRIVHLMSVSAPHDLCLHLTRGTRDKIFHPILPTFHSRTESGTVSMTSRHRNLFAWEGGKDSNRQVCEETRPGQISLTFTQAKPQPSVVSPIGLEGLSWLIGRRHLACLEPDETAFGWEGGTGEEQASALCDVIHWFVKGFQYQSNRHAPN